ncbi:hypothetical protein, partial [Cecembia sp.]|uniref:hypothetical protein n=1 Tax=Cecembia sp. TaxID=1898110 RepID=UPI0025C1531B
ELAESKHLPYDRRPFASLRVTVTIDRNVRHSDEGKPAPILSGSLPKYWRCFTTFSMTRNFVITLSVLFPKC